MRNHRISTVSALLSAAVGFLTLIGGTPATAQQERILHNFVIGEHDGSTPYGAVVFDKAGNMYGTTFYGGAYNDGTVFEMSPKGSNWTESVLFSFDILDGSGPSAGLVIDGSGNLYGTTAFGGANGNGVVFELSPGEDGQWTETTLHTFDFNSGDGNLPDAPMVFDAKGNLYGTTAGGGTGPGSCGFYGCGTVFELSPQSGGTWTETILHNFSFNGTDGYDSEGGPLVFDSKGSLYGTTGQGGAFGDGTVFELLPAADGTWTETILHSFNPNGTDGIYPDSGVIFDSNGNLYGTTYEGGSNDGGDGAVYELSPGKNGWTEIVLSNLGGSEGAANPYAGVAFDASGNLWGTTVKGGAYGWGTVYELRPAKNGKWSESVVHNFDDSPAGDGWSPYVGLTLGPHNYLYGVTTGGGKQYGGTVFEMIPQE